MNPGPTGPTIADPASTGGTWSATAIALAMAGHDRLGDESPLQSVANSPDLLKCIMSFIELVVPDDAPTLAAALDRAGTWQRVLLRRGTHEVSHASITIAISRRPIWIEGEAGAILRGCLVLGAAGGRIERIRLDDAGDCCIRCVGGQWHLRDVRLRCSHGAALHASGGARVTAEDCTLGGEGEHEIGRHVVMLAAYGSVQVKGLAKRSCYAVVARGRSEVRHASVGRSGPNLKPGTVCVCGMSGLRKGMDTTQHPPSPASRAGTDLPTTVQAVSRAVTYVNTHRPRFQVRARPS